MVEQQLFKTVGRLNWKIILMESIKKEL